MLNFVNSGVSFYSAVALSIKLCIAIQNLSIDVNVVSKWSPSRILKVRRISLGITIRPRSSTLRTIQLLSYFYLLHRHFVGGGVSPPRGRETRPLQQILQFTPLVSVIGRRLYNNIDTLKLRCYINNV